MPRRKKKRVLTVENWGPLRKHQLYWGRIRSAAFSKGAPGHLQVEIVNLDPKELDRRHTVNLPPTAKPGNRTHALLVACGIEANPGARIELDQLVNHVVGFRLCDHATGASEQFDFEQIPNPPAAETAPATKNAAMERPADNDVTTRLEDEEISF
jgi:hypothetical protein